MTGGATVIWATLAAMPAASPLRARASNAGEGAAILRPPSSPSHSVILREIDDPATGNLWLLEQEVGHPGGPGRLVLATGGHAASGTGENGSPSAGEAVPVTPVSDMLVIRAGDAVMLVAHTAVMDAALEAVALAPARAGAAFPVRLKMGGKVVKAVALGAGRAAWVLDREEMR